MTKINLLPHKAQKVKDVRRVTIIIAAVQAVIFLAVILLYVFISVWEARLYQEVQSLDHLWVQSPVQQTLRGTIQNFLPGDFLTTYALTKVQEVPNGVRLYAIRFEFGEFGITAHTNDILNIRKHIETLYEYFYDIRLSNLMTAYGGYYVYELNFSSR